MTERIVFRGGVEDNAVPVSVVGGEGNWFQSSSRSVEVTVFRYVDDLSTAEVAALLDRSVPATESLLARARRELARIVREARIVEEDRDEH